MSEQQINFIHNFQILGTDGVFAFGRIPQKFLGNDDDDVIDYAEKLELDKVREDMKINGMIPMSQIKQEYGFSS